MKKILFILCLTSGLLFSSTVHSQNYWEHVYTQLNHLKFAATDDGTIYGTTNETFLLQSTSNGDAGSWNLVNGFPIENAYSVFAHQNTVFMLNYDWNYNGLGIYASTDGGDTWETRNTGLGGDTNIVDMYEMSNNVLLLQTNPSDFVYNFYRSTDGGNSWSFVQDMGKQCYSIVVVSNNEAYLAAGSTHFKSTNNGQNWTEVSQTSPGQIINIMSDDSGNNLIASSFTDIMESSDGGNTWTSIPTPGLPDLTVNSITTFRKLHDETIYISLNNDEGVYYSEDNAQSWTDITSNINSTQINGAGLFVSPTGYLFASPSNSGVYRSVDPVTNSTVSLEDISEISGAFSVYPNPANDQIFISSDVEADGKVEVLNSIGQVVYSENMKSMNFNIDVSGFTNGMYILKIKTTNGTNTSKFVIE